MADERGGETSDGGRRDRQRRTLRPLDAASLQDLALGYAARYATTAAKLTRYLARKLKERGWAGDTPPDLAALVARLGELRYVDDRAFAGMKARDMTARGLGARRIGAALAAAGVGAEDRAAVLDADDADAASASLATALAFARRRRLGPFARTPATDPRTRQRELAAMLRAGHAPDVARRILDAPDPATAEALIDD